MVEVVVVPGLRSRSWSGHRVTGCARRCCSTTRTGPSWPCASSPEWQEAMRRRGITDFEKVQIDPWPAGNFGNPLEEGRRIARCLSYYREEPARQRLRPPGRGRAGHGGRRPGRRARGATTSASCRSPRNGEATSPRTTSRCGPDSSRWRSSSRTVPASPSTATCSPGSTGRCGCPWNRWRAWSSATSATTTAASGPSSTGPPSARWSSPTAIRDRCTAGRTPSMSASGGSAAWPTRWRWAATASARSPTWTPSSPANTARRTSSRTRCASTRRTTGSSGSTTT